MHIGIDNEYPLRSSNLFLHSKLFETNKFKNAVQTQRATRLRIQLNRFEWRQAIMCGSYMLWCRYLSFVFVSHTARCYFGILYHSDKNSHLTPVRRHTQMLFKQARTRFCHSALWFWKNRFHIELKLLQSFIFYSKCWFIFAVKMFWGKWKWNSWYFPEK